MRAIDLSKPYLIEPIAARSYLRVYSQLLMRKEAGQPLKPEGEEGERLRAQSPAYRSIKNVEKRSGERIIIGEDRYGYPLYSSWTIRNGVATIDCIGPILRYGDFWSAMSGMTSTDAITSQLQQALDYGDVKSIILNLDSPGGEVTSIGELATYIRQANSQKRIVAYGDGMVCSAAYWLASACDDIVLSPTGMAGSIGTIWAWLDDSKALAMEGLEEIEFISSQSPNKNPDPKSKSGKAQYQQLVDDITSVFGAAVAAYRGVSVETVFSDYGRGGVMLGQRALDAGLVDRLGDYESLLAEMASGQQSVRRTSPVPAAAKVGSQIKSKLREAKVLSASRPHSISTSQPTGGTMAKVKNQTAKNQAVDTDDEEPETDEPTEVETETDTEPAEDDNESDANDETETSTDSEAGAEDDDDEDLDEEDTEAGDDLTSQALDATPENIAKLQSRLAQTSRRLGSKSKALQKQKQTMQAQAREKFTASMKGRVPPTARGAFATLYGALQTGTATPATLEAAISALPKAKILEPIGANLTEVEAPKATDPHAADIEAAEKSAAEQNSRRKRAK